MARNDVLIKTRQRATAQHDAKDAVCVCVPHDVAAVAAVCVCRMSASLACAASNIENQFCSTMTRRKTRRLSLLLAGPRLLC